MSNASTQAAGLADDAKTLAETEIAALRAKVETLMNDRVSPAIAGMAEQAEAFAHGASETAKRQADNLAGTVRAQPFAAVGAAVLAGLAIGLLIRR